MRCDKHVDAISTDNYSSQVRIEGMPYMYSTVLLLVSHCNVSEAVYELCEVKWVAKTP